MSDTINIGGITVSKFYLGGSSDVKIYLGTTKLYPHLQEPCFAVVDNISTYTARTYVDVYETSSDKWYKLNNLNAYEEYGVYGSSTATTYYDGKLSVYDGYEYMYSGSSWQNIGEISGSSRVPIGYTEVEYIENESVAYINTSFKPNQDTRVIARMQTVTSMMHARFLGAGAWNGSNGYQFDYENYYDGQLHISWGGINGWSTYNYYGDYNVHTYDWNKNVFTIDNGVFSAETTYTSFQCDDNLGLFVHIYNGEPCGDSTPWSESYERSFLHGRLYFCQIYDNGTLIRDLVPCTRDSDSKVGVYDVVNDVFYSSAYSGYEFVAGSASTSVIYPLYYPVMQDPPSAVTFSSMTEAEEYECPYVGLKAIIAGDNYIFSGDSQSGYEWVEQALPYDAEIQYLENSGTEYIDTGVYLNTSNFEIGYTILGDRGCWGYVHQMVVNGAWVTVSNDYAYFGSWNNSDKVSVSSYVSSTENTIVYTQSGITVNGTNLSKNLNLKGVDNLNSVSLPLFAWYDFNSMSADVNFNSKFKSFYVKNNGVLVRDMIPVRVGQVGYMYDRVSGQLFGNAGTGSFILGPDVN